MSKLYTERDIIEQGDYYSRHTSAMTGEDLHSKSDIAAELAHRDIEIDKLKARVAELYTRPAPADQGDTCTWELDHGDSAWAGECGIYWSFIDDGPQENGVKFCPKCGKSCVFVETNQEQGQ
jgi:hypothetical protein